MKKAWVEKAKIKSKWRAQKRREGIVSLRSAAISQDHGDATREVLRSDEDDEGGGEHSESASNTSIDEGSQPGDNGDSENGYAAHSPPPPHPPPPPTHKPKALPPKKKYDQADNKKRRHHHDKNNHAAIKTADDQPTLRDLFQEAYSKSSLHTYKSDPLKKRRGEQVRGRGGNATSASARGRGQPNMKLRMNAMLEKIKRDYS